MAAQRFAKARIAIAAGVTAAVIGGSGYFYQAGGIAAGAESNTSATSATIAPQAASPSSERPQAARPSTARRSRAS